MILFLDFILTHSKHKQNLMIAIWYSPCLIFNLGPVSRLCTGQESRRRKKKPDKILVHSKMFSSIVHACMHSSPMLWSSEFEWNYFLISWVFFKWLGISASPRVAHLFIVENSCVNCFFLLMFEWVPSCCEKRNITKCQERCLTQISKLLDHFFSNKDFLFPCMPIPLFTYY